MIPIPLLSIPVLKRIPPSVPRLTLWSTLALRNPPTLWKRLPIIVRPLSWGIVRWPLRPLSSAIWALPLHRFHKNPFHLQVWGIFPQLVFLDSISLTYFGNCEISSVKMISRNNFHNVFFFLLCKYDFDFVIPLFPFDDFVAHSVENYQIVPSRIWNKNSVKSIFQSCILEIDFTKYFSKFKRVNFWIFYTV